MRNAADPIVYSRTQAKTYEEILTESGAKRGFSLLDYIQMDLVLSEWNKAGKRYIPGAMCQEIMLGQGEYTSLLQL